jgi:predicted Na+-dependent transporter
VRVNVKQIRGVFVAPLPIFAALVTLHLFFPALVYLAGRIGIVSDPDLYTGIVLLSSIPTGVSTIMWVTAMGGNVALGLTLITLDSVLSPVVVPATVKLLAGAVVDFDAADLMSSLVKMIVIPTIIGVAVNEASKGRVAARVAPYGGVFAKAALGAIIGVNVAASWDRVAAYTGNFAVLLSMLLAMTLLGFVAAYLVARVAIRDRVDLVTVTFVAGMRNISAGVVLAMDSFGPLVSIPVTAAILFQQPVAAVIARFLHRQDARSEFFSG